VDVGYDQAIYLLFALRPLDYYYERNQFRFVKTTPDQPQSYRVLRYDRGTVTLDVTIENETFNIHELQPLQDELLLVCGRSYYRRKNDYDKNGRVYSLDGKFQREFLLGDGIASVQTNRRGEIWTSYFDEGVLGNFGWKQPVGAAGLVMWDADGQKLYEHQPRSILDCYAMNVTSNDDVWIYYYTTFPLVHLHRRETKGVWPMPVRGSRIMAIRRGHVLIDGGYDDRGTFHLFSLENKEPKLVGKFEICDRQTPDKPMNPGIALARGNSIWLISDGLLYRLDVERALEAA
jgi:hypothetical protein